MANGRPEGGALHGNEFSVTVAAIVAAAATGYKDPYLEAIRNHAAAEGITNV